MIIEQNGFSLYANPRKFAYTLASKLLRDNKLPKSPRIITDGFKAFEHALEHPRTTELQADEILDSLVPYNVTSFLEAGISTEEAQETLSTTLLDLEPRVRRAVFEQEAVRLGVRESILNADFSSNPERVVEFPFPGSTLQLRIKGGIILNGIQEPIDEELAEKISIQGRYDSTKNISYLFVTHIGGFGEQISLKIPYHDQHKYSPAILHKELKLPAKPSKIMRRSGIITPSSPANISLPSNLYMSEDDYPFRYPVKFVDRETEVIQMEENHLVVNGLEFELGDDFDNLNVHAHIPFSCPEKVVVASIPNINGKSRETVEFTLEYERDNSAAV